jgi:hypothetical protein
MRKKMNKLQQAEIEVENFYKILKNNGVEIMKHNPTGDLGETRIVEIQEFKDKTRVIIISDSGVNQAQIYDLATALKHHRYKIEHQEHLNKTMEEYDSMSEIEWIE